MNKKQKRHLTELPGGVGVTVVDGDINYALQVFRQEVKKSGKLKECYDRREFIKPSTKRRHEIQKAIYRRKIEESANNS